MKRTIVAINDPAMIQEIKSLLALVDYQGLAFTGNGMEALRLLHRFEPDLMIIGRNLSGLNSSDLLQTLLSLHLCPTMVVLDADEHTLLAQVVKAGPHQVVFYPLRAVDFGAAVLLAEERFKQERESADRVRHLEDELKARKLIYQALLRLIQALGWDEEKAYTLLRSEAMAQRRSIRSLALDIIKGNWFPDA
ncbi:Two component system, signal transduction response regulator [Acididesulfobacillus acetoxydans]|uniref:Stage 0 sporulation protein A homolog n=1 Tax=Acididesulfobacillus acetoxydans TaxID=1561005 RepID=A0A8S0WPE4_9FIRM|nr:ANTAR domain-containing protein [Acididesulfobacillus acetoxydans]CAA7601864.1 Two component system, signal transduction response regulator [Acididesulfobacillus acetoxydans]CEJ08292.1 Response regulator [Acididesulfobacillus acetoxydans]